MKNSAVHFAIAAAISFALYLLNSVIPNINFGNYTLIAAPIVAAVTDGLKRFFTNYENANSMAAIQ